MHRDLINELEMAVDNLIALRRFNRMGLASGVTGLIWMNASDHYCSLYCSLVYLASAIEPGTSSGGRYDGAAFVAPIEPHFEL